LSHRVLQDATLWGLLPKFDEDLAEQARARGCRCGGVLHRADYPRKPRGGPVALGAGYDRRLSFCCDRDGCRGRVTPPSVRLLGRKVYLGAFLVLASALMNGPTPRRVAALVKLLGGVSERTLRRWSAWWRSAFAESAFWKGSAGRFATPVAAMLLPHALLERFGGDERERLVTTLRFLTPVTIDPARFAMAP